MKLKNLVVAALLVMVGVQLVEPAVAARRAGARRAGNRRAVVMVRRGWPIRRPLRTVVVRPARVAVRVAPAVFLAPVVFTAQLVATAPAREVLEWEDGETLSKADDWTELTLNCDRRGTKLYIEIEDGKIQADWAEVVFENGEAQVVDFAAKTREPGLYELLDFKDGRKVDHVRMVARAQSDEARIVLKMEK
jgi:hypothetical protein